MIVAQLTSLSGIIFPVLFSFEYWASHNLSEDFFYWSGGEKTEVIARDRTAVRLSKITTESEN